MQKVQNKKRKQMCLLEKKMSKKCFKNISKDGGCCYKYFGV